MIKIITLSLSRIGFNHILKQKQDAELPMEAYIKRLLLWGEVTNALYKNVCRRMSIVIGRPGPDRRKNIVNPLNHLMPLSKIIGKDHTISIRLTEEEFRWLMKMGLDAGLYTVEEHLYRLVQWRRITDKVIDGRLRDYSISFRTAEGCETPFDIKV